MTLHLELSPTSPGESAGPDAPGDSVSGVVRTEGPTTSVTLFGEPLDVVEQDPALSAWFSDLLGTTARLVAAPATTRRRTPGVVEARTLLSDEGSVSVHSAASLADLNARLAAEGHPALPADRFRANLVLDGCPAWAEDDAVGLEAGEVSMRFAQVDDRCAVTTVDQAAGRRAGPEPLRTLATFRRGPEGGVRFGVYTAVVSPGRVSVGDPVLLTGADGS